MNNIEIHLTDITPEQINIATTATDAGTRLTISFATMTTPKPFGSPLNPSMTFDKFIVGTGNQFPYAAARAVAENRGERYNPLLLCGERAHGKTHLLHAIGNAVLAANPQARVLLTTGEQFVSKVINSIRYQKMAEFREEYRSADFFLFDDLSFIAGKERTQEEFFLLLRALVEAGKQVVIASSAHPNKLPGLEEQIRSHLDFALIADFQPLDKESKMAILVAEADEQGISLTEEVIAFLAEKLPCARTLKGCVIWMAAGSRLSGVATDLNCAKQYATRFIDRGEDSHDQ
jgi:chromosomal replication initiator protein